MYNALAHGATTVGGTSSLVRAGRARRASVLVKNNHASNILYLGKSSAVAVADGFPLAAGESVVLKDFTGDLYAIASAAGTDVRWMELG